MLLVKHLLAAKSGSLWTIDAEDPVLEAIELMARHHIGALPVLRNGTLAGIVSERDYARKVILRGRSSAETAVWEIMSAPVTTVGLTDSVPTCMQLMTERRVRHLPVLDAERLIAIVSIGDVVKALMEEQRETIDQLQRFIAS